MMSEGTGIVWICLSAIRSVCLLHAASHLFGVFLLHVCNLWLISQGQMQTFYEYVRSHSACCKKWRPPRRSLLKITTRHMRSLFALSTREHILDHPEKLYIKSIEGGETYSVDDNYVDQIKKHAANVEVYGVNNVENFTVSTGSDI